MKHISGYEIEDVERVKTPNGVVMRRKATTSIGGRRFYDQGQRVWKPVNYGVLVRTGARFGNHFLMDSIHRAVVPIRWTDGDPIYAVQLERDFWLTMTPEGNDLNTGVVTGQLSLNHVRFNNLWNHADLTVHNGGHNIGKYIHLLAGHGRVFAFRTNMMLQPPDAQGFIGLPSGMRINPPYLYPPENEFGDMPDSIKLRWRVRGNLLGVVLPEGDYSGWRLDPTITLQPGPTTGYDTYCRQENQTANYSSNEALWWKRDYYTYRGSTVQFRYDLTGIPVGSTIQQMKWYFYVFSVSAHNFSCHRMLAANDGWAAPTATWNKKNGVDGWAGCALGVAKHYCGCSQDGTDFDNTALGSESIGSGSTGWKDIDFLLTQAQALFDQGNIGIAAVGPLSGATRSIQARSSDYVADPTQRHYMEITYDPPAAQRLNYYTFNIWDPEAKILDLKGHKVNPVELKPDRWMEVLGMDLPSSTVYEDLVENPGSTRITQVEANERTARILPNPSQFADVLLRRAGRGL